jgi:ATP-binding cassette subfamily F protein uup
MPLLTLDDISLAFGHLPLLDGVSLRIEPGERICLIGRNGTGKSSLLRVITGEVAPDAGTIWKTPGMRISRLEQDVPGKGDRTVFDEVAAGLGELGELVADYHHAAVAAGEGPGALARSRNATGGGWSRRSR